MHEKFCSILSVSLFLSVSADVAKNDLLKSGDNGLSTVNNLCSPMYVTKNMLS